jgi:hypothetical protein
MISSSRMAMKTRLPARAVSPAPSLSKLWRKAESATIGDYFDDDLDLTMVEEETATSAKKAASAKPKPKAKPAAKPVSGISVNIVFECGADVFDLSRSPSIVPPQTRLPREHLLLLSRPETASRHMVNSGKKYVLLFFWRMLRILSSLLLVCRRRRERRPKTRTSLTFSSTSGMPTAIAPVCCYSSGAPSLRHLYCIGFIRGTGL